jgi:class I lanthipeptide synthase
MDQLLNDFAMDLSLKLKVLGRLREDFEKEFDVDQSMKRKMAEIFRRERKELESLFAADQEQHALWPGLEIYQQRSERLRPLMSKLMDLEKENRLTVSTAEIAGDLLHMHANRLLRSAHREQELVLYDFLVQLYRSAMLRNTSSSGESTDR